MSGGRGTRRRVFAILLLLQIAVYGWLILGRRLPRGHDTLSIFLIQSLFLSGAGPGGSGLLWVPYLAHGVVGTWFTNLQSGLLQNSLLLAGGVPSGTSMLPVFYAGLFMEDLVLMIGMWRLGARYFRSPAAQFFVAATAVGSSLWVGNIFWNHRLIFAIPLVLSLLLDVVESGSRGKFLLAASLLGLHLLGNAVYIPMLSSLVIGLYVALHVFLHRKRLRTSLPLFRPRPLDAAWLAALAILVAAVCVAVLRDMGSIRQYHPGRNPDGSVTLDEFLTYPGNLNALGYLDFLTGLTPCRDYSLYCGISCVLLAASAFTRRPGKTVAQLALFIALLVLFSLGYLGFVGAAGYALFPPLHFFRYVSLAAPIVKLLLILLAGVGIDALARAKPSSRAGIMGFLAAGLVAARLLFAQISGNDASNPVTAFFRTIPFALSLRPPAPDEGPALGLAVIGLGAAAATLIVWKSRARAAPILIPLLLVLQITDVFRWRLEVLREDTLALSPALEEAQRVRPLQYIARRAPATKDAAFSREVFDAGANSGIMYDYCDAFLRRDPPWTRRFATHWSPPVDLLLRAHARRPLTPDDRAPVSFESMDRVPPKTLPAAYAKLIGEEEDKLQVFSSAHRAASDDEIAEFLNRPDFGGDLVLLSADNPEGDDLRLVPPSRNERVSAVPKVLEYAGDRIRIDVTVPAEGWLVYTDSWHPGWKASVDGTAVRVERANLAYKAVRLHGGRNDVEFRFRDPLRSTAYALIGVLSASWCLLLLAWTLSLLVAGPERTGTEEDRRVRS